MEINMSERENGQFECPLTGHPADLVNVKFFRGTRDDVITGEEILAETRSAEMQVKLRTATISNKAPVSAHPVMNVREFVQAL